MPGRCGRREIRSGHRGTIGGASIGANIVADDAMFPSLPRRARNWGVALLAGLLQVFIGPPDFFKGHIGWGRGDHGAGGAPRGPVRAAGAARQGELRRRVQGAAPTQRHDRRRQGHPALRGGRGGAGGHPTGDCGAAGVRPPERGAVLRQFHGQRVPLDRHGALRRRERPRHPQRVQPPAARSADRVPLRRDAQRPRLPPLHLQGAQGHKVQQHLTHGERRGQARRLRRRRAAHADHEQAQHLHRHPALDGPGGDSRIPLRRKSGRVGAGHLRDRDGGNPTAQARRPPHARHLHDHQGAIPAAGESRGEA